MPKLRDYQRVLRDGAESGLRSREARLMLQLPTGGGKTVIAGDLLARRLKGDRGSAAVWLTHRVELAEQTCGMLRNAGVRAESRPGWTSGDDAPRVDNGVAILMAQTVGRREPTWTGYGERDLLVVDEAHHATAESWQKAIQWWPGPVLGMTATPWRLSVREGFDHLFDRLITGPQVWELQGEKHLCQARARAPDDADTILGGAIDDTGDYSAAGIISRTDELRPGVLTAGVLRFWRKHAEGRQTVVYAVSVGHANNLAREFAKAGVSAGVIHTRTAKEARRETVESFREGGLMVLINVAIATEGFDLPDASCVVLARPTLSLALYLQMVGRGLRAKSAGNSFRDCLILDLAGNTKRHGLPEDEREWFLEARGEAGEGQAWTVYCPECDGVSPASSHYCRACRAPFGKECGRCGKWRVWGWWAYEWHCGGRHAAVCDLCHYDAHIQLAPDSAGERPRLGGMHQLMEGQIRELETEIRRIDGLLGDDSALDKEFDVYLDGMADRPRGHTAVTREFGAWRRRLQSSRDKYRLQLSRVESGDADGLGILEKIQEGLRAVLPEGEVQIRINELKTEIRRVDELLEDGSALDREFDVYLEQMPNRPRGHSAVNREFGAWKRRLQTSREKYRLELSRVEAGDVDGLAVLERIHQGLRAVLPEGEGLAQTGGVTLRLTTWVNALRSLRVASIQPPTGAAIPVVPTISAEKPDGILPAVPDGILPAVVEWLIGQGYVSRGDCPIPQSAKAKVRCLINVEPFHIKDARGALSGFTAPVELSNGWYLETAFDDPVERCEYLLERFGLDPWDFRVNLAEDQDGGLVFSAGWDYWQGDGVWDAWEVESVLAPTGEVVADDGSPGVLVWLAEWLIGRGKLQGRDCPFMARGARTRYLVNDEPVHRNGRNFVAPERLSNGMYLERAQNDLEDRWLELLEHCGEDAAQFRVSLAEIDDDDDYDS